MLIDSHAHLDMHHYSNDLGEVIGRARDAGIGEVLTVGYDAASFEGALGLADTHDMVYAALGVHPHNAKDFDAGVEKRLKKLILRRKVLALGEIGLDFYRDLSPRERQREVFRRQIGIALYFEKPIIVHAREAFDEVITILDEEGAREVGGIFHAFSGSLDEAIAVLKLGFLIGIGGPITYKNSGLPPVVSRLPSSAIVLETDCPYLPPVPFRGKRNEPAYVRIVAELIAGIRGVDVRDVERMTEISYRNLLHGESDPPPSIAYRLKNNIYVNVTSSCTNDCSFCPRAGRKRFLYGYNLNLITDPSPEDMVEAVRVAAQESEPREIVFCGYGEPTTRIADVLEAALSLKSLGIRLRLNTNGHGNMINRRNIVPELGKVFDKVSISLNAPDKASYVKFCRPDAGGRAFDGVLDFITKCAATRLECEVTALDFPGADIEGCRALAEAIPGAAFHQRKYHLAVREQ